MLGVAGVLHDTLGGETPSAFNDHLGINTTFDGCDD
jgi:hypothetical protein